MKEDNIFKRISKELITHSKDYEPSLTKKTADPIEALSLLTELENLTTSHMPKPAKPQTVAKPEPKNFATTNPSYQKALVDPTVIEALMSFCNKRKGGLKPLASEKKR